MIGLWLGRNGELFCSMKWSDVGNESTHYLYSWDYHHMKAGRDFFYLQIWVLLSDSLQIWLIWGKNDKMMLTSDHQIIKTGSSVLQKTQIWLAFRKTRLEPHSQLYYGSFYWNGGMPWDWQKSLIQILHWNWMLVWFLQRCTEHMYTM